VPVPLGKEGSVKNVLAKGAFPSVIRQALGKGVVKCHFNARQRKVAVTTSDTVMVALPSTRVKALSKVVIFA
jgi:hypothetical protein